MRQNIEITPDNLKKIDDELTKWEKELNEEEARIEEAEIKIKMKTFSYQVAEENLEQIEDNLRKFMNLVKIFEDKAKYGENCFLDNIERLKNMSLFFEDHEAEHAITTDKIQSNEEISLKEHVKAYADAYAKFSVYRDIAQRAGLIK